MLTIIAIVILVILIEDLLSRCLFLGWVIRLVSIIILGAVLVLFVGFVRLVVTLVGSGPILTAVLRFVALIKDTFLDDVGVFVQHLNHFLYHVRRHLRRNHIAARR